jgi:membrane-bound lytic murein transglycosylase D
MRGGAALETVDHVESRGALEGYAVDDFFRDASDPAVERLVRYYSHSAKGQATLQAWLSRAELYRPMVERTLQGYGLPTHLLAVAIVESGLDPLAVSPVGATGLWQFMQTTGRSYGLQITEELDERRQPQLATDAAARHLRDLYVSLGDWPRALAAYNAGEERVRSVSDEVGSTHFWMMRERSTQLPKETADYVPRVFAVARLLTHGGVGADKVRGGPAVGADLVATVLPVGLPLEHVANALGMQRTHLQRLNPEVIGSRVPEAGGGHELRVPKDRAHLAELLLQPSLEGAAGVDRELLRRVSNFSRAVNERSVLADAFAASEHMSERQVEVWDRLVAAMDGRGQRTYRVRKGDSLHKIAKLLGVNEEHLQRENALTDPNLMQIGMVLVLPSDS